jgi:hypothetical protein
MQKSPATLTVMLNPRILSCVDGREWGVQRVPLWADQLSKGAVQRSRPVRRRCGTVGGEVIGASIKRSATRRVDGTARVPSAVRPSRRGFSGDADRVRRGNYASGRHGSQSTVIDLALSGFVGRPLRFPSGTESPLTSYSRGGLTPPQAGCDGFGVRRGPVVAA